MPHAQEHDTRKESLAEGASAGDADGGVAGSSAARAGLRKRKIEPRVIVWAALACVAALPMAQAFFEVTNAYWSTGAFALVVCIAWAALLACAGRWRALTGGKRTAWALYALTASATALLGGRVERTEWYYTGNFEQNRMGDFVPADALWVLLLAAFVLALAMALLRGYDVLVRLYGAADKRRGRARDVRGSHARQDVKGAPSRCSQAAVFLVAWACLFACWLPYFFTYWPGAIYSDSISSIEQALGMRPLTDHHPVAYTMMLGAFLRIGHALGSYQLGCAIYTVCQMLFVAGVVAFLLVWLRRHGMPWYALVAVWAYFALPSIFALHAISMWKDALYAAFLLLVACTLFDVAASCGQALARPAVLVRLAVLTFAVCFARNNGIYVMAACWLLLACAYGFRRIVPAARTGQGADGHPAPAGKEATVAGDAQPALRRNVAFMAVGAACMAAYLAIAGPGFAAAGIRHVPVESYAVPLQQASAVVVFDGAMTPSQRDFMNSLLPLDQYQEEYLPCSVDGIKWAGDFDTSFFEGHRREFLAVWAQMMLPNAKVYLDAYVLETYEYWSFGDVQRNGHRDGVNTKNEQEELGIVEVNLLEEWFGEDVAKRFSFCFYYPCEGVVAWVLLFLLLRQLTSRRPGLALMLAPALLSWGTLLLSAPFAGLQRYALPSAFLLPVALLLPLLAERVWALCGRGKPTNKAVD